MAHSACRSFVVATLAFAASLGTVPVASAEFLTRDHSHFQEHAVSTNYLTSCSLVNSTCKCECRPDTAPGNSNPCGTFNKTPTKGNDLISLLGITDPAVIEVATYGTCEYSSAGAFVKLDGETCAIDLGNPGGKTDQETCVSLCGA